MSCYRQPSQRRLLYTRSDFIKVSLSSGMGHSSNLLLFQLKWQPRSVIYRRFNTTTYYSPKIPDNLSFEEAASIPVGLTAGAAGLYNPITTGSGLGLTPPWEGGEGKYRDQGILIIGGASSVGQYSKSMWYIRGSYHSS